MAFSVVEDNGEYRSQCGYCGGADSAAARGFAALQLTVADYQGLLDRGWRRSGRWLYKPCMFQTCCPQYTIRLDVRKFAASKEQKKCHRKMDRYLRPGPKDGKGGNEAGAKEGAKAGAKAAGAGRRKDKAKEQGEGAEDAAEGMEVPERTLTMGLVRAKYSQESFELYKLYQTEVHKEKEEDISQGSFKRFLVDSPLEHVAPEENGSAPDSGYGSFHLQFRIDGKLVAVSVVDILPRCLSSVYAFWDPAYSFLSLGKFTALKEIEWVQTHQKPGAGFDYYYMGFYIHSCPKMSYKAKYKPSDLLCPEAYTWFPYDQIKGHLVDQKCVSLSAAAGGGAAGGGEARRIMDRDLMGAKVLIGGMIFTPQALVDHGAADEKAIKDLLEHLRGSFEACGLDLVSKLVFSISKGGGGGGS